MGAAPNPFAGRERKRGRDAVLDLQLPGRVLAVSIHRARADAQLPRDLLRIEVCMDKPEALALSLGQQRYEFSHAFHLRRSFDDEVSLAVLDDTSQHTRRALLPPRSNRWNRRTRPFTRNDPNESGKLEITREKWRAALDETENYFALVPMSA